MKNSVKTGYNYVMTFKRKAYNQFLEWKNNSRGKTALMVEGARRVGKSTLVTEFVQKEYEDFLFLDFAKEDDDVKENFKQNIGKLDVFFRTLFLAKGKELKPNRNTVIVFDEVQLFPLARQAIKYLVADGRYDYIETGSLISIKKNKEKILIPSEEFKIKMYPMDFEEFLIANNFGSDAINYVRESYENKTSLNESLHNTLLNLFLTYLYVGGLPDAVKSYVEEKNVFKIKEIQKDIYDFYSDDAAKYDLESRLKIKRIYEMMISSIDNKVKRIKYSDINDNKKDCFSNYAEEFDYLINSGIALACNAVSEPKFPLAQSSVKNLIKLYMNDVGLLSYLLYRNNINAILKSKTGVNLGAIYETVVSQELKAHGHDLFYYDRRKVGEVDFLVNDYDNLSILPLEIKSGKEGYEYRALPKLVEDKNYRIKQGYVLSNDREVLVKDKIVHLPIYYIMFV